MRDCNECGKIIVIETGELVIGADSLLTIDYNGKDIYNSIEDGNVENNGDTLAFCDVGCFNCWLHARNATKKTMFDNNFR